jgi:transcription elongation factor SPT6
VPFLVPSAKLDAPSVLAVSWGKGESKDLTHFVFLDEAGRMREYSRIDNFQDTAETVEEFTDILKKCKPDVIAIGGFSMATLKLTVDSVLPF